MVRTRLSLQEVVQKYDTKEDASLLENLIRAFRKIQRLPPSDPDSFYTISGYHGEPFLEEDPSNVDWWGGYCQHQTVLFPTWHRAYLLRLESALRNAMPDADISMPYWDECLSLGSTDDPIPWVLTAPTFPLDGEDNNPLYSYTLQQALADNHSAYTSKDAKRYNKPAGYKTVRYPLSGLVGNDKELATTIIHNATYRDPTTNTKILNSNIKAWLEGTVQIQPDDVSTPVPDTYSAASRYAISLNAENYTIFSNKASMAAWITSQHQVPHYGVALEEGHNAIHLALGGFYQRAYYNADPIRGANGDMGENETAAFDPIFYFHHAFVDYVFWTWQRIHDSTTKGSLNVIAGYDGTTSAGDPTFPKGTALDMSSPLAPFKKADGGYYTSDDVTDIENLDDGMAYTYAPGSMDVHVPNPNGPLRDSQPSPPLITVVHVKNVNRAKTAGSFVIRTFVETAAGEKVEIGREAVLSRWHVAGCSNCQGHLNEHAFTAVDEALLKTLGYHSKQAVKDKFTFQVEGREEGLDRDGNLGAAPGGSIELL